MSTKSPQVYRTFSMDFTFEIHHAQRGDGQWFTRTHEKTSRGWQWGAWRKSSAPGMDRATPVADVVRLPVEGATPRAKRAPRCCGINCHKGSTAKAVLTIGGMHIRTRPHCGDATCLKGYADFCGAKSGEMVLASFDA